jgi:hypothetical protein
MLPPLNRLLVPALAACLSLAVTPALAQEKKDKPPVTLLSPKDGAVVPQVEELEGRVDGKDAWPVVFVRPLVGEEPWWVQPAVTDVVSGQWTGKIHFGNNDTPAGTKFSVIVGVARNKEEAAKFKAGTTLETLPPDLPHSAPITVYRDKQPPKPPEPEARSVSFAGRTWQVKAGRRLGPGPNDWSDSKDNVWVDDKGYLHLAVTRADRKCLCAEVVADKSLGYGEYRWVVSGDLPALDRWVVLGLFTYETTLREIDFELSRWGDAKKPNAQFVVQPYTAKDSTYRFDTATAKLLTASLLWEKGQVRGRCWEGEDTGKKPLADWTYTGSHIPPPGKERARANLWLFDGKPPASGERQEVVLHSFAFQPAETPRNP